MMEYFDLVVAVAIVLVIYLVRQYNDKRLQEFCNDVYEKVYEDLEKRAEARKIVETRFPCAEKVVCHKHAVLMAQYAEDAKVHSHPWKLWLINTSTSAKTYRPCQMADMTFRKEREYKRKFSKCQSRRCGHCDNCYQEFMI